MIPQPLRSSLLTAAALVTALTVGACGGAQSGAQGASPAARSSDLQSHSGVSCQTDSDCDVCYRESSCGEAVGARDPALATAACHASPSAFCMPRRAHCDERRCVAR